jgi:hypothetical protein
MRLGASEMRYGRYGIVKISLLPPEIEPRPEIATGWAGLTFAVHLSITKNLGSNDFFILCLITEDNELTFRDFVEAYVSVRTVNPISVLWRPRFVLPYIRPWWQVKPL